MTSDQDMIVSEALTAEDRLRLHVHDPLTFAFMLDDAEQLVAEIDALRAALRPKEAGEAVAPDDQWVLVPREPTESMMSEGVHAGATSGGHDWSSSTFLASVGDETAKAMYKSMLAAAPASPSSPVSRESVIEAAKIVDEMRARNDRNGFLTDWWCERLDALHAALSPEVGNDK